MQCISDEYMAEDMVSEYRRALQKGEHGKK